MSGFSLILIGAWLMGSGWHSNSSAGLTFTFQQKAFVPWLGALLILWGLSQVEVLRGPVKAITVLSALAVVLKQWPNIEKSLSELKQTFKVP